jgi:hypothetical protein
MSDTIVIEDSTIVSMVNDERFNKTIPCLMNQAGSVIPAPTGCGSCARKRAEAARQAIGRVKACIVDMSVDKKNELKQLLNAQKIKLVFATATGQISTVTF